MREAPPEKGGAPARRMQCCSKCGRPGHNIRTCGRKEKEEKCAGGRCPPSPPPRKVVAPKPCSELEKDEIEVRDHNRRAMLALVAGRCRKAPPPPRKGPSREEELLARIAALEAAVLGFE